MSDPKTEPKDSKPAAMTAAAAAKRVKRTVVLEDGGKRVEKQVPLKAEEILAFKDYGTHVVVVTTDGQKFSDAPAAETAEA